MALKIEKPDKPKRVLMFEYDVLKQIQGTAFWELIGNRAKPYAACLRLRREGRGGPELHRDETPRQESRKPKENPRRQPPNRCRYQLPSKSQDSIKAV